LNNEKNEDKLRKYISLLGGMIRPPSLKKPTYRFEVEDDSIVAPISIIKGIGPKIVAELVSKGPFDDLQDFMQKITHTKVNIGAISVLIKGRAADSMMDSSLSYIEARKKFIADYLEIKKAKSKFKEDMYDFSPLTIFLQEREFNKSFNKHLLSDNDILSTIESMWPGLKATNRKAVPFMLAGVPVLSNIKIAEGILNNGHLENVALILLYESSAVKTGVSKKTGKPWCLTSIKLSDGYATIEASCWDKDKPLRWTKDSIVYVRGRLKEGFRAPVSITVDEIELIERE
jgi:DNA polymerase III alpha subunit